MEDLKKNAATPRVERLDAPSYLPTGLPLPRAGRESGWLGGMFSRTTGDSYFNEQRRYPNGVEC